MYRKRHFPIICALFCAVVSIVLGIGIGSVNISPGEIFTAIGVRFFGAQLPEDMPITTVNIITDIRMPRVVLAFLTGAALSASGAAVQSVLRNPPTPWAFPAELHSAQGLLSQRDLHFWGSSPLQRQVLCLLF